MKKLKVIHVISGVEMSWQLLDLWSEMSTDVQLEVVLIDRGETMFKPELERAGIECRVIVGSSITVFLSLLWRFLTTRPDIVHTHLRKANFTGLGAAWCARIGQRVYTRHSSDYNHRYYPSSVKYDRLLNRIATSIVSISPVVSSVLTDLEDVPAEKVWEIPHGFKLERFVQTKESSQDLRNKYDCADSFPIVTVISRLLELKGIEYTIGAFHKLLKDYPKAKLLLFNSTGPYRQSIQEELGRLPEKSYQMVPFEKDMPAVYALTDIYVHVPIDTTCEAYGQTYIEALSAARPCIFTRSGIAHEILEHESNCLVVPYKDPEAIHAAMLRILREPELSARIQRQAPASVSRFTVSRQSQSLIQAYG